MAELDAVTLVDGVPQDSGTVPTMAPVRDQLISILAKIIAAPATEAKQDAIITALGLLATNSSVDGIEALLTTISGKDFATQTTLAAILAKIIAAPATEAKQDTLIAKDFATQTTLATLLLQSDFDTKVGSLTESAPGTDTASSGLNGRLQRIAQNLTSAIASPVTAGENHIGAVGGHTVTQAASSTITRPGDTTAYASGDLVANSTTAGSVNALQFTTLARVSGGSGEIVGAAIQKSTTGVTNAAFRVHFFNTVPTFTSAGDNSAISSVVVASGKGYLGYVDITAMTAFSDVAWGTGAVDNARGAIPFKATAQIIYAIVEARGAYAPGNAEVFTVYAMAWQD